MNKFPMDERTPKQIEAKAKVYTEWLREGGLNAMQMRAIRLFLKRHGATMKDMPHNETITAGVFKVADALVKKGYRIRNLEDDSRDTN